MGDNSKIEWTDHTFSPWWGCSRVSPGCVHCYADALASRWGHEVWRRKGPRRMLSEAYWAKPLKWNRDAEQEGAPAKVFCGSMCDVFEDHPAVTEARKRLFGLIEITPWLRWQLTTKRIENVAGMVPWGNDWPPWVWLGTSVENQRYAWSYDDAGHDSYGRLQWLAESPAAVHFVSAEPLLGAGDLGVGDPHRNHTSKNGSPWSHPRVCLNCSDTEGEDDVQWFRREPIVGEIDWVIIGGESGPKARRMELRWVRQLIAECQSARVAVFVKQLGSKLGAELGAGPKGGDISHWPDDLRIREFPSGEPKVEAGAR